MGENSVYGKQIFAYLFVQNIIYLFKLKHLYNSYVYEKLQDQENVIVQHHHVFGRQRFSMSTIFGLSEANGRYCTVSENGENFNTF